MTNAIAKLQSGACNTTLNCATTDCSAAIKVVLMAHDTCSEKQLPNNLEVALHDYEEHCAAQLCNSAASAFDPYNEKCAAPAEFFEWKGVFLTPESTYKWGAQKKNGKYADPTMNLAAIPVSS